MMILIAFFLFTHLHEFECFVEKLGDGCMANYREMVVFGKMYG